VIKIGEFLKNAQFKYKFNVIRCRGYPGKIGISPEHSHVTNDRFFDSLSIPRFYRFLPLARIHLDRLELSDRVESTIGAIYVHMIMLDDPSRTR
jgi:hypothetical protein